MRKNKFKIKFARTVREIKEGIESFEKGEGRLANESFVELAEKHGISYDVQKCLSDLEIIGASIDE